MSDYPNDRDDQRYGAELASWFLAPDDGPSPIGVRAFHYWDSVWHALTDANGYFTDAYGLWREHIIAGYRKEGL